MRYALIVIILAALTNPCACAVYPYSFEGSFEGWTPDACDDEPGPNWSVTLNQTYHYAGSWSLKLYMNNYNDATKVWIEKPFLVPLGQSYFVDAWFHFASADWGDVNLFNVIASISGSNPETMSDFVVLGNTGNGNFHTYVWLLKHYSRTVMPGPSEYPGYGLIWVAFGVWGTWETPRTYYLDDFLLSAGSGYVQTVSIPGAKSLIDGSMVRIENRAVSSATADLAGRIYVEELDRQSGIAVEPNLAAPQVARNKRVTVVGVLETLEGERRVRNASVSLSALSDFAVGPLFLGNREIGGSQYGQYTPGVSGRSGLNNIGLLVTSCGRVVSHGSDYFVIDDGWRRQPCGKSSIPGVAVSTTGLAGSGTIPMPADQSYVIVTGLSSSFTSGGQVYPLIRPRNALDVVTYPP